MSPVFLHGPNDSTFKLDRLPFPLKDEIAFDDIERCWMLESGTENSEIDDADWTPAKASLDRFGKSETLKLASLLGSLSHPGIVIVISAPGGPTVSPLLDFST